MISSIFISQQLQSLFCDHIEVVPNAPRKEKNWWCFKKVVIPINIRSIHWIVLIFDMTPKTSDENNIEITCKILDSLASYEKEIVNLLPKIHKYLTLQYLALHGKTKQLGIKYEFSHRCTHFRKQTWDSLG